MYGLARSVTGTPTSKHGWVGQPGHTSEDETGLVYMRARYMDPVTGRFLSEDPARSGSNWLLYCNNNPVNYTDMSGKDPTASQLFFAILAGIFGVLAGAFAALGTTMEAAALGEAIVAPLLGLISLVDIGAAIAVGAALVASFAAIAVWLPVVLLALAAICAVLVLYDDIGHINETGEGTGSSMTNLDVNGDDQE